MKNDTRTAGLTRIFTTCIMMGLGACIGLGLHSQGVDTFLAASLGAASYVLLRAVVGIRQDAHDLVTYLRLLRRLR